MVTDRDAQRRVRATVDAGVEPARGHLASTLTVPPGTVPLLPEQMWARLLLGRLPVPGRRLSLRTAGRWMAACRALLGSDSFLITAVGATDPIGTVADHATTVIVAARASGLLYHQHLVTVFQPLPDTDQDRPRPLAPGDRHTRIHADLFVFAAQEGTPHA